MYTTWNLLLSSSLNNEFSWSCLLYCLLVYFFLQKNEPLLFVWMPWKKPLLKSDQFFSSIRHWLLKTRTVIEFIYLQQWKSVMISLKGCDFFLNKPTPTKKAAHHIQSLAILFFHSTLSMVESFFSQLRCWCRTRKETVSRSMGSMVARQSF